MYRRLAILMTFMLSLVPTFAHVEMADTLSDDGPTTNLREVNVSGRRNRYKRKGNPAVEMIRKVIEAKAHSDLHRHDFASYRRYERMTMALNEVTEDIFREDKFRRLPFLKNYVERNARTGKLILPFVVDEKTSRIVYRRADDTEKTIIEAARHEGMDDLLKTGEVLRGLMEDCFTDVDIYEDDIRLLQYHFISPISTTAAIRFYHYFIEDTLSIEADRCYKIGFTPANVQDFGFSGALYVMADSTWRVKRAEISVPRRTDINFVRGLDIEQTYETLANGQQICRDNNMLLQLAIVDWAQKLQVERRVRNSDWSFEALRPEEFAFEGGVRSELDADRRDSSFWSDSRPVALSSAESRVGNLSREFLHRRGFKGMLWVSKAFIESYVETTFTPDKKSRVDIGPVYQVLGSNFVEGFRLRLGAQTTAHLSPHWFVSGWGKYGFRDQRWKGEAVVTYSPRRRSYFTQEFPVSNISLSYTSDVRSPADKFLSVDRDDAFSSTEWARVRHMNYFGRFRMLVDWEWKNGLRVSGQLRREWTKPAGDLFYRPLSEGLPTSDVLTASSRATGLTYAEASLGVTYQPGASYVCTKMHRLQTNFDTPVMSLRHTIGLRGVWGGDYDYNYTEVSLYKRFWWRSWGKMDCLLRGAVQWNRVPWTLLVMPAANTSYFLDKNKQSFTMMRDMELLSDRAVTLNVDWDLNGKILNRIPWIKRLKWRENVGVNMMWGMLTDRNNPTSSSNAGSDLLWLPGRFDAAGTYTAISAPLDRRRPYVEITAGVHNVFKFFRIEYVRRLTYLHDGVKRWGVRGCFEFSF